jgi:hypothetical protein
MTGCWMQSTRLWEYLERLPGVWSQLIIAEEEKHLLSRVQYLRSAYIFALSLESRTCRGPLLSPVSAGIAGPPHEGTRLN